MTAPVELTPAARADLLEGFESLAADNLEAAHRFLLAARKAIGRLADHPDLGMLQAWRDPRLAEVRMWPIPGMASWLVFYRSRPSGILILRILHGTRDLAQILLQE
ncbi:MAG: type II toxin-antitoxin system RelE/ParE family toxin [Planctomycetota bacterium]|nr:MAG: type II toxin-antitoxin system RelE/ParE family toxin [Planctomycetota bacterium]